MNEDAVLVSGTLLAVADGVGGAPRGDLASRAAVDAVEANLTPDSVSARSADVARDLAGALMVADESVLALAEQWRELSGSATTMCAALVFGEDDGPRAVVVNVGDSRCYHIRDGGCQQVTTDQTLGTEMRSSGVADPPHRADSIVTNILGGDPAGDTTFHVHHLHLAPGDVILLVTDGISDVVSAAEMVEACAAGDPSTAAQDLVRRGYDAGSNDNLTAVVGRIVVLQE